MNLSTRRFCRFVTGSALLLATGVVAAAEFGSGWFVDSTYGETRISRTTGSYFMDGAQSGFTLGVGYALNDYLAFQASYHDFGDHQAVEGCPRDFACLVFNVDEVDVDGLSVAAIGSWPVHRMIDVYGKLGLLRWDADFARLALDESGEELLYGVGIGVTVTPRWRVSLGYDEADFDLRSTRLGLRFAF